MTIYDIAKAAGVSASTVSRVINNKPGINEKTREKIQKILDEENFSLNQTARGLSTQSTKMIGILLEDIRISHHTESAYIIEQEMTKHGYTCLTFSTGPSKERKAEYIRLLEQRRVDGAILIGSMFGAKEVAKSIGKHLSDIPIVIANGYIDLPNVFGVLVNEEQGVMDCVKLLEQKGKRKIAFLQDHDTPSNNAKRAGFEHSMLLRGFQKDEILVYSLENGDLNPEYTIENGKNLTKMALEEHPDIDGIIYSVDLFAVGGLEYMEEKGISVPDQISIMGIDNTLYGKVCRPRLTTLNNKLLETSRYASRMLLEALEQKEISHKIMLFTDIIERETT